MQSQEKGGKPLSDEQLDRATKPAAPKIMTAAEIAAQYSVSDTAIRVNWFNWLAQVAPEQALRTRDGYTPLAQELFSAIATKTASQRRKWVQEAKSQYEHLWTVSANTSSEQSEQLPECKGGALSVRAETVEVTPFDLGESVQVYRLNTQQIDAQTEQIWDIAQEQEQQAMSLLMGRFEALGDRIVAEGKNRVARKVAQGLRDLVQ